MTTAQFHITDSTTGKYEIYVKGDNLILVNMSLLEESCPRDLMLKRETIIQLAKEKGVKISYRAGTKTTLDLLTPTYKKHYKKYSATFSLLSALWRTKLEKGIDAQYENDKVFQDLVMVENKIHRMWDKHTPLSDVHEVKTRLNHLYDEVKNNKDLLKITL